MGRRGEVMFWLLVFLVLVAFVGYLLREFAKHADMIEDDTRHLFANRERAPYGSKFLSLVLGRSEK
jgi:hypothetical protein